MSGSFLRVAASSPNSGLKTLSSFKPVENLPKFLGGNKAVLIQNNREQIRRSLSLLKPHLN